MGRHSWGRMCRSGGPSDLKLSPYCDLVLLNGNVVTVDARFSMARGSGHQRRIGIAAVGSDDQIKALIGSATEVVDLKGRTVLPGINDSHSHTALWAGTRPPYVLDLAYPRCRSVKDIVERGAGEGRRSAAPGEWVRGIGWDAGYLEECSPTPVSAFTGRLLDAVSPDNPVALTDFSVHTVWVNSRALELAGMDAIRAGPVGGGIEKDPADGEPTGILAGVRRRGPGDGPHPAADARTRRGRPCMPPSTR